MSTGSSSTQLCSQQLDDILGPDLTQFEILICQMISKDEDQVSRSKALFDLALRSRPDSLLLALSELLSPFSLVRVEAAKQIGEIFTTFSSNFRGTTLDTLKLDLLSAYRNEVSDSDVRKALLRTISVFHATGSWPELLPNLFECLNSQSPDFQEYALLVFKSLAENSNGNAALIPHLETFQEFFSECVCNSSNWDFKIAALDASISFVQFIPNREDPNRFAYLLDLMILTLSEALDSGSEYKTEDTLHLLIRLAETEPRFFERHLRTVSMWMFQIQINDSLDVNMKHLAIQFLMALVKKAPSMISKNPKFIRELLGELMYMLVDIECVDADASHAAFRAALFAASAVRVGPRDTSASSAARVDIASLASSAARAAAAASFASSAARAAAAAAAASSAVRAARAAAAASFASAARATSASSAARADSASSSAAAAASDNDEDGDGDEVDNFWESSNYILGKECLSKLSILLGDEMIFCWVRGLFSYLLGNFTWQHRHAVLIAIPEIAKVGRQNLGVLVPMVLNSLEDSHPRVCMAAINAIRKLSVVLGPWLQWRYGDSCFSTLIEVMNDSQRPKLQAPATSAMLSFFRYGPKLIINTYERTIMEEFHKFTESHFPNLLEKSAIRMLSQNIDQLLQRPLQSPEYLPALLDSYRCMPGGSEFTELKRLIKIISGQ